MPASVGRSVLVLLALAASASLAWAHDFRVLDAVVVVKADRTWTADLRIDVDALALGVSASTPSEDLAAALGAMAPDDLADARERARRTIERRVRVRFDGEVAAPVVSFPGLDTRPEDAATAPSVLGTVARLDGYVPRGATSMTFFASRAFGPVRLTVLDQTGPGGVEIVAGAGEETAPYRLGSAGPDAHASRPPAFATYLGLGFEHILPRGVDHILFVLGLFLLGRDARSLLLQVSAFTVAHTITLALAMMGWVRLPSSIVEPLIALSIAWIAIENVFADRVLPWRPFVVFGFGLLHGLGFAGVLTDLGLPPGRFVSALVGFNVGVELGQLAVLVLAFLAVGWFRNRRWYRARIVVPASLAIGLVGLYWTVLRLGLLG